LFLIPLILSNEMPGLLLSSST